MKKAFFATAVLVGTTMLFPAGCLAAEKEIQTYKDTDFAMDTVVTETLYTTGDDINSKLTSVLTDVETNLLSWTNEKSQIYKVNAESGKDTEISDELSGYLERILKIAKDSDGAFDPTIGKLIRLWDIGGEDQRVPEKSEIQEVLKNSGYEKVSVDGKNIRMDEGCSLDLGAAGKGIGCDSVLEYLSSGVISANIVIDAAQMGPRAGGGVGEYLEYGHTSDYSQVDVHTLEQSDAIRQLNVLQAETESETGKGA